MKYMTRHTLALLAMAAVFSLQYRVAQWISPAWAAYVMMTLVIAVAALVMLRPPQRAKITIPGYAILLVMAAGLYVRYQFVQRYPVDVAHGDMLPLIQSAVDQFLSGRNPYGMHQVPHELPLTFFPGLWLSYVPTVRLGIDLRWTGWVSTLVIGLVFMWNADASGIRRREISPGYAALIAAFFLLPIFSFFTVQGHTQPYWMMLVVFAACFLRGMDGSAAIALGLCLGTRQTALIFLPFVFLLWIKQHGWRKAAGYGSIAALFAGVLCLPFVFADPEAFLLAPLRHYGELAAGYAQSRSPHLLNTFGFANVFHLMPWEEGLSLCRLVVWVVGFVGAIRWARTRHDFIRWMAVTGVFFTFFTPIPWFYAYFPYWLLLVFNHIECLTCMQNRHIVQA